MGVARSTKDGRPCLCRIEVPSPMLSLTFPYTGHAHGHAVVIGIVLAITSGSLSFAITVHQRHHPCSRSHLGIKLI